MFFLINNFAVAQTHVQVKAEKGDGIYSLLRRHGLSPTEYVGQFIELNKSALGKNNSLIVGRTYKLPVENKSATQSPTSDPPVSNADTQAISTTPSDDKATPSVNKTTPSDGKTEPPVNITNPPTNTAAKAKTLTYDIFGAKYKNVTIIDNQLAGSVYYLVSGHGGPDPGAVGQYGNYMLCEDEYAYDVTLRLARRLIEHGATVHMIVWDPNDGIRDESILRPDNDEKCYSNLTVPRGHVARLRQRKDAVNELYVKNKGKFQRLVEIHIDSRSKGKNIDVFFYHDKESKTGKKLAINLQQTFKDKYRIHQPNRGYHGTVSDRNLYMLKYTYPPTVFIELGNINHHRDQQRFMIVDNRQALANWLAEGLIKDFKNNK